MLKLTVIIIFIVIVSGILFFALTTSPANVTINKPVIVIQPTPMPSSTAKLIITDTAVGTGSAVKAGDTVTINYEGKFDNGQVFDSSYTRGQPFVTKIGVGQVIPGWDQGILGLKVGGRRHLVIPPDLAYGTAGIPGAIPPNSTLLFDVELVAVSQ